MTIIKYPRTPHLEGSRFQPGDENLNDIPLQSLKGQYLVIEEKLDGANSGISFEDGKLQLQSRGHYLVGGPREKQFELFKSWAHAYQNTLWEILGNRYIMYGEWLYAKHTIFYNNPPHYFFEFDIYDKEENLFLSTNKRQELLLGTEVVSVPILWEGLAPSSVEFFRKLITHSSYKTSELWWEMMLSLAELKDYNTDSLTQNTDRSNLSEGLYIKVEIDNETVDRCKFIRKDFLTVVLNSEDHWMERPIFPNVLAPDVSIF